MNITKEKLESWSKGWPKAAMGEAVSDACEKDKNVVVLAADLAGALGVNVCSKYDKQYYNVGIAEQNMLGIACGLALSGKTPLATSFVPFLTMRACEQIRTGACYMNLNVKLLGSNAGVRGAQAGASHWGLEDISLLRCIPNMKIFSPSDGLSLYKCIEAMMQCDGPAYVRVAGVPEMKIIYDKDYDFEIGKAIKLKDGERVALLATGPMVAKALNAAEILEAKGIRASVYDFQTIKPLDEAALDEIIKNNDLVITLEENAAIGGFGSAVAEYSAQNKGKAEIKIIGFKDRFMGIGAYNELLEQNGLLPEQIAEAVEEGLK